MTNQKIGVWISDWDNEVLVIATSGEIVESIENTSGRAFIDWPWDLDVYGLQEEGIMVWEGEAHEDEDTEWKGEWRRPTPAELKELVVNGNPW